MTHACSTCYLRTDAASVKPTVPTYMMRVMTIENPLLIWDVYLQAQQITKWSLHGLLVPSALSQAC